MPLDLLRKAASFILGKLGFENASEALDSFNFQDIIKKVIFSFVGFLRGVVNGLIEGVAVLVEKIPFAGEAADKIRGLKFKEPEGGPKTESAEPVDMEAPDQQAVSGGFMDESFSPEPPIAQPAEEAERTAGQKKYDRIVARRERKQAQLERQQSGQQPVVSIVDNSTKGGDSVQQTAMVAPMADPFDNQDPMFNFLRTG